MGVFINLHRRFRPFESLHLIPRVRLAREQEIPPQDRLLYCHLCSTNHPPFLHLLHSWRERDRHVLFRSCFHFFMHHRAKKMPVLFSWLMYISTYFIPFSPQFTPRNRFNLTLKNPNFFFPIYPKTICEMRVRKRARHPRFTRTTIAVLHL